MATCLPNTANQVEFEPCWKCNLSIEMNKFLRCLKCKGTFHRTCVKKTENCNEWKCSNCLTVNTIKDPQTHTNVLPEKTKSISGSQKSTRSNVNHELQLLEEQIQLLEKQFQERERHMAEKHRQQQEILAKKMELLRESNSSDSGSNKSFDVSKEQVENWNIFEPNSQLTSTNKVVGAQTNIQDVRKVKHAAEINPPNQTYTRGGLEAIRNHVMNAEAPALLSNSGLAARQVIGRKLAFFDGDPLKWCGFISQFETSTNICELTNAENLVRLDECLKGNARASVEGLLYLPDNVPVIIQTLRKFFGRPEFVVNALVSKIQNTGPRNISLENFEEIITFSAQVSNVVVHMKQSSMSDYLCNPILMHQLIEKLPCQYKVDWAAFRNNMERVNLDIFSSWLEEKASSLTFVLTKPPQFSKQKPTKAYVQVHNHGKANKCIICESSCGSVIKCPEFESMSYASKWEAVHKNRLCRVCLKQHLGRCRSGKKCEITGCPFMHNTILHKPEDINGNPEDNQQVENHLVAPVNVHKSVSSTLFKIIPVRLYGKNGKTVATFALLDDGSALTLMEDKLASDLEIDGSTTPLCLQWTNEQQRMELNSRTVNLSISGIHKNDTVYNLNGVRTVNNLSLPSQSIHMNELVTSFPHLKNIPATSYSNAKPSILIGLDHPRLGLASRVKCGGEFDPIAIKSKLGWIIFGSPSLKSTVVLNICECNESWDTLNRSVKEFISIDMLGSGSNQPVSEFDKKANDIMERSLQFKNGKYHCKLLWKYNKVTLPNNYKMALNRLNCLQKRLGSEDGLRNLMEDLLADYHKKGYIRSVSEDEIFKHSGNCWYLPVFPVRNPNKPKKLRIVWDAAASVEKTSLNSMLLTGPDLLASLPGVLLRFREKKFAIGGDLMEMFHQIKTAEEDQKYQWFLWKRASGEVQTFAMTVMTFGAVCSPFIAQYVKNYHARKFSESAPEAVNAIVNNHYMDDWLDSFDSEHEVVKVAKEVSDIYKTGGFVIRNWISNSPKVLKILGEPGVDQKFFSDLTESKSEKILGLWWNVKQDVFTFSLKYNKGNSEIISGNQMPTKREMLRIIMSIFDPLGFLAHFLIYARILMQRVWRKDTDWDDVIPLNIHDDWRNWIKRLPEIQKVNIVRWYGFDLSGAVYELHTFVDASEEAYAASVYLRVSCGDTSHCRLVFAKSRTAPVKALTIPRLELNAAVLGVRLARFVQNQQKLTISKRYFWSDSRTVVCWINSESRNYKQFVSCRIGEIHEATDVSEWFWIPTKKNVADHATRLIIPELNSQSEWFCGPAFLKLPQSAWPVIKGDGFKTEEEIRPRVFFTRQVEKLVEYLDFSTFRRLRDKYMSFIRFFSIWKIKALHSNENLPPRFCTSILRKAELAIFKTAQREVYNEDITQLINGKQLDKNSSLYTRMAYLDKDEILRCKGRIDFSSDASFDTKRPIILPAGHHITNLIIFHHHEKYNHHNHETVVNELRQRFSVSSLRQQLWKIRRSCQQCKNDTAKPSPPEMAQLPPARLQSFTRPFSYVGVDFFGPMTVSIGRRQEKRWGMLMTCLTVRAIHLECVHTLNTSSCILGLRNFINRRGCPIEVYSDNGTNLKGASRELLEARSKLNMDDFANEFLEAAIKWIFIPPASPHMGGAWERLVRSVKSNISYITKARSFKTEYLTSLLIEVECIINSRPLSYIPIDDENSEALTPNHFLLGSSNGNKPIGKFDDNANLLRNNWHTIQKFANMAWKRWIKEELPALNSRTIWHSTNVSCQLKVDDIVLVFDESSPRCRYPKGRVIDVNMGNDGLVRSATVKTSNGIYRRPVVKLAKLEVYKESIPDHSGYRGGEM